MYIHASSGKWYNHSYSFLSNRDEFVGDHYLIGKLSWLDRLAVARTTVRGEEAIHRQNVQLYFALIASFVGVATGLWVLAGVTNLSVIGALALVVTIGGLMGLVFLLIQDSVDIYHPSVSHPPSVKLAEWWLTHGARKHRLLPVTESRTLRVLATGHSNSTGNINLDNSAIYRWFEANPDLKPEIDALLLDPEIHEIELLLKNRPATPSDEDRETVAELKRRLDAKVSTFTALVAERAEQRVAAEQAEFARQQAEADRHARQAADEESARNDAWRQRTTRVLNPSQD